MLPELNLEGRSAIVTGAGRGIGKAIALRLAEAGADIVLASRTKTQLEETAHCIQKMGRRTIVVRTDMTNEDQVDNLVQQSLNELEKIDIMVNNAGQISMIPVVPFPDITLKPPHVSRASTSRTSDHEWNALLNANLNSVFYGCRAIGPHMMERRYGKIINISSIAGKQAFPIYAAYCVSKSAIDMLTRVLALEWADYNICVNALAPGWYQTDLNPIWDVPEIINPILADVPMGREGDPAELGAMAAYLSSSASDYMTGQIVYVDGGLTAK